MPLVKGLEKSHRSALVGMPPLALWGAIQELRWGWDRQVRRWPPHVNLIYPGPMGKALLGRLALLQQGLAEMEPFPARLGGVGVFVHRDGSRTVWLRPEPWGCWQGLHACLRRVFPEWDELDRLGGGFTPHLSVGQARDARAAARLVGLAGRLVGLSWWMAGVTWIRREHPLQDRFSSRLWLPLGRDRSGLDPVAGGSRCGG